MANKNFEVKHGLSVGGTERISSAGAGTFTDLTVSGTTTTINTATLLVADKNIVLNYHASNDTSGSVDGAGITIQDAVNSSTDATFNWSADNDRFVMSHGLQVTAGNVGIGTASPAEKLHVVGDVRIDTDLYIQPTNKFYLDGGNDTYITEAAANVMAFNTAGAERFRISNNKILLSSESTTSSQTIGGAEAKVQLLGNNAARSQFALGRFTSNNAAANFNFLKSRSASVGSNTIVQDDDKLGLINWYADDGTDYASLAATILAQIDAASGVAPGANDTPGRLVFKTTSGGSDSPSERMRIGSNGNVGIGETSPHGTLHVKSSDSGATADSGANDLVVENSSNAGISILSGASASGSIYFGDSGVAYDGYIQYDQTNRKFNFITAAGGGGFHLDSVGNAKLSGGNNNEVYMDIFSDSGSNRGAGYFRFLTDGASAEQSVAQIYMEQGSGDGGSRKCNMYLQVSDNGNPATAVMIENNKAQTYYGKGYWPNHDVQAGTVLLGGSQLTYDAHAYAVIGTNSTARGLGLFRDMNASYPWALFSAGQNSEGNANDIHFSPNDSDVQMFLGNQGGVFGGNSSHNLRASGGNFMFNSGSSNFIFEIGGVQRGYINASGFNNGSDISLKENIKDIDYGLNTVLSLKPRKFDWKDAPDNDKAEIGFIAQEVEEFIPEIISESAADNSSVDSVKGLNYGAMTAVLVKAIQELQAEITLLKEKVG